MEKYIVIWSEEIENGQITDSDTSYIFDSVEEAIEAMGTPPDYVSDMEIYIAKVTLVKKTNGVTFHETGWQDVTPSPTN